MVLSTPTRYAARLPTANAVPDAAARYQMNQGLLMPPVAATPTVTKAMSTAIQIGVSHLRSTAPRRNSRYMATAHAHAPAHPASATVKLRVKTPSAFPTSEVTSAAV